MIDILLRVAGAACARSASTSCRPPSTCRQAASARKLAILIAGLALGTSAAAQAADPDNGKRIFDRQCRACHSLVAGSNGVGPSLHGLFGRKAGTLPRYNYSPAMKRADMVWTEDTLKQYLTDPHKMIPGDKMVFAGIKDAQQLDDLIAYLKIATP